MLTCVTYICYVTSLGWGGCWRLSKSAIPCSLSTRTNGHVNAKLMRSIRVWQWRWMNSKTKSLLELTGHPLKKRMAMWGSKKQRTPFQEKNPCKLHVSMKKALQFPGEFSAYFGESVVSLWWAIAVPPFFIKVQNAGVVLPPTGSLRWLVVGQVYVKGGAWHWRPVAAKVDVT